MAQPAFTDEEKQHAAHLFNLVTRQILMGVPPQLALATLAIAAGQVAHAQNVPRDELAKLVPVMEQAWEGHAKGVEQGKAER